MILQRIEGTRFSRVVRAWSGKVAIVIACGPSLRRDQIERARIAHDDGARVLAVNDAFMWAPWADAHYAADSHWHRWMCEGIAKPMLGMTAGDVRAAWAGFGGQKCTIQSSGGNVTDDAVHMLRNRDFPHHGMGLSMDPEALVTGRNSGFQALNLAVLAGATRIMLIGFDGKPAADGRDHFHGGHPRPTPSAAYPFYRQAMSAAENALAAAGVEVVNCTPGSAIDSFRRATLEDALAEAIA